MAADCDFYPQKMSLYIIFLVISLHSCISLMIPSNDYIIRDRGGIGKDFLTRVGISNADGVLDYTSMTSYGNIGYKLGNNRRNIGHSNSYSNSNRLTKTSLGAISAQAAR